MAPVLSLQKQPPQGWTPFLAQCSSAPFLPKATSSFVPSYGRNSMRSLLQS